MIKYTFEDFLMEKHGEQYIGTDDMMPDDFNEVWIVNLEIEDWIKYGDEFAKVQSKDLLAALKNIAEGCSFPENEIQKAIRDRAKQAIIKVEGK